VQQELTERLQAAIGAGPLGGQWRESALRMLDDEGGETFLSTLAALDDRRVNLGAGLSDEQFSRDLAAMFAEVGSQRLVTSPVPGHASALLLGLGLGLAVFVPRRRAMAPHGR
jgi:hypothetical protein